jgi:hypothetical protein
MMAAIKEAFSGTTRLLEPEHLIGRGSTCSLRLQPRYISARHALLRWAKGRWRLRDLGSRNGTFIDGERVRAGEEYGVRRGSKLAFGRPTETSWEVVDESAPAPMVVPSDGEDPVVLEGDLLAIPSAEDPRAMIYRHPNGHWVLEQPDAAIRIGHLHLFEVAGRAWRFCCVEDPCMTTAAVSVDELHVSRIHVHLLVAKNEEHVEIQIRNGARAVDLGTRTVNDLLVTLARARLDDAKAGLPDAACGWVDSEELARDPSMAPPQLHVDVFRIRKHFAAHGVVDAANVIERRPRTRQLRVGIPAISIGMM